MKPRVPITAEAVRAHGRRTVCSETACRICTLLNRAFLDELRLSIGLERMPRHFGDRTPGPNVKIFGQSYAWRQDGRVSVMRHD